MRRGQKVRRGEEREERRSPLSPTATGIALGLWITAMLLIALVVVPTLFATCFGPMPEG